MPTIELVCLSGQRAPELPHYQTFCYRTEQAPQSHRALFQADFDRASGPIVHLGNKDFEHKPFFWASDLIKWSDDPVEIPLIDPDQGENQWWGEDQSYAFRFRPEVVPELQDLLSKLLDHSPERGVLFTTDYQFGPVTPLRLSGYTLTSLLQEHAHTGLRWNTLYHVMIER